ncbi:cation:proton antiporter [Tateyamaria sp. SN6-1]|uniref:cation:proton antiporter n=1 Tax=Tateyamaria sp. SN6-1 TaxID=3092148 RepID=UPI0039F50FE1
MEFALILIAGAAFAYALLGERLSTGVITAPMLAIALGLALATLLEGRTGHLEETLHLLAEITLVIVLFSDAAMVKARALREGVWVPLRMLVIGLPLAMLFGYVVNMLLLPGWPVWELALLAAILAPTDAALGQAVVTNPRVPERLRSALTVESGVNDGLALPAVLFFGCLAVDGIHDNVQTSWTVFAAKQIGLGGLAGAAIGAAGAWLMSRALLRGLANDLSEGMGVLALAALCYLVSVAIGGNGFLAAFVGGLTFGLMFRRQCKFVLEFLETEGQLLVLGTFVLLGVVVAPDLIRSLSPTWIALILISLFVTRPVAIWLSLLGTRTTPSERLFLGWFGPRGLATALFALLVLQEFDRLTHGHEILLICFLTVVISAVLHGMTAAPAAKRFSSPKGDDADG